MSLGVPPGCALNCLPGSCGCPGVYLGYAAACIQVVINSPQAGVYSVEVLASSINIPGPDGKGQRFALVARGPIQEQDCLCKCAVTAMEGGHRHGWLSRSWKGDPA